MLIVIIKYKKYNRNYLVFHKYDRNYKRTRRVILDFSQANKIRSRKSPLILRTPLALSSRDGYSGSNKINSFNYSLAKSDVYMKFSNLKHFMDGMKDTVRGDVFDFSEFVKDSKEQINNILKTIECNANLRSESLSLTLSSQQVLAKEREQLISDLEKKVLQLNEQLSQYQNQKMNGAVILQLESELEDKKRIIQDLEINSQTQIDDLKFRLDEMKKSLNHKKDERFQTIQYQTIIDEKTRALNLLKRKHKEKVTMLKSQIKEQNNIIDSLSSLQIEIEKMKVTNCNKDKEISQLKEEINSSQIISTNLERSINESNELKNKIKSDKKKISALVKSNKVYQSTIEKSNEQLISLKNEISVLKAEKSMTMNQLLEKSQNTSISTPLCSGSPRIRQKIYSSDTKEKINDEDPDSKSILDICNKYNELKIQFDDELEKNRRLNELIEALRTNNKEAENENKQLIQKVNYTMNLYNRKENRIDKLKIEIINLNQKIKQKEDLIDQLLQAEKEKSIEIERLYSEIDRLVNESKLIKETDPNTFTIEKKKYDELLNNLANFKRQNSDLDIQIKLLNSEKHELEGELNNVRAAMIERESLMAKYNQENKDLILFKKSSEKQVNQITQQFIKQINDLKTQLKQTTEENTNYCNKYKEVLETSSKYSSIIEELRAENANLSQGNYELSTTNDFQILPLQNENNQLKLKIKQLQENNIKFVEENRNLVIENAQIKASNQYALDSWKNETEHSSTSKDLQEKLNEAEEKLAILFRTLSVKNIDDFMEVWKCNIEKSESIKFENKKLESMVKTLNSQIDTFKKKEIHNKNSPTITFKNQCEDKMKNELQNSKQRLSECINEKAEKEQQIIFLESQKEEISQELNELKRSYEETIKYIESLHSLVHFDSVNHLKDSILLILSENKKYQSAIFDSQALVRKAKSKNEENEKKVELQQKTIEKLNNSIQELRNQNLTSYTSMNQTIFELRDKLQESEEKVELFNTEIKNLQSIFHFSSIDDLSYAVQAEIQKKDHALDELRFKYSQAQNIISSKQNEVDNLNKTINEKKEENKKIKQERNNIRIENLRLTKIVNNSDHGNATNSMLSEIAILINSKDPNDVIPSINNMKNNLSKKKTKISLLKNKIETLEAEINKLHVKTDSISEEKRKLEEDSQKTENLLLNSLGISSIAKVDQLKQKIENSKNEIVELKRNNQKYLDLLNEKNKEIINKEEESVELRQKIDEFSLNVQNNQTAIFEMKEKISELSFSKDSLIKENDILKTQLFNASSGLDLEKKEKEIMQIQIIDVTNELKKEQSENRLLKNENKDLKTKQLKEKMKLEKKLELVSNEKERSAEETESIRIEKMRIEQQLSQTKDQSEIITQSCKMLKEEKENMESSLKEIENENWALNSKINDLTHDILLEKESFQKQIEHLKKENLNCLESIEEEKKIMINDNEKLKEKLDNVIQNSEKEKVTLATQLSLLSKKNQSLQADIKNIESNYKQEIAQTNKKFDKVKSEKEQAMERINDLELKTKDLVQTSIQLESLNRENKALKSANELLKHNSGTETHGILFSLQEAKKERDSLRSELEILRNNSAQENVSLSSQLKSLVIEKEAIMKELEETKANLLDKIDSLNKENEILNNNVRDGSSSIKELQDQKNKITSELNIFRENSSAQLFSIKEELDTAKSKNKELQRSIVRNTSTKDDLQTQILQLTEESREIVALKDENDSLKLELKKMNDKIYKKEYIEKNQTDFSQRQIQTLEEDKIIMQKELQEANERAKAIENENNEKINLLQSKLDQMKNNEEETANDINKLNNEVTSAKDILSNLAEILDSEEIIESVKKLVESSKNQKHDDDETKNQNGDEKPESAFILSTIEKDLKTLLDTSDVFDSVKQLLDDKEDQNKRIKEFEDKNEQLSSLLETNDFIGEIKQMKEKLKEFENDKTNEELVKMLGVKKGDLVSKAREMVYQAKTDEEIWKQLSIIIDGDSSDIVENAKVLVEKTQKDEQFQHQLAEILQCSTDVDIPEKAKELILQVKQYDEMKKQLFSLLGEDTNDFAAKIADMNNKLSGLNEMEAKLKENDEIKSKLTSILGSSDFINSINDLNAKYNQLLSENNTNQATIEKISQVLLNQQVALPLTDETIEKLNESLNDVFKNNEMAETIIEFAKVNGSTANSIGESFAFIKDMIQKNIKQNEEMIKKMQSVKEEMTRSFEVQKRKVVEKYENAREKIKSLQDINNNLTKLKTELINLATGETTADIIFLQSQLTFDENEKLKLDTI